MFDIWFHYEGQKRTRKMLALLYMGREDDDETAHQLVWSHFDDIRVSMEDGTAEFYTRGIKTAKDFYPYKIVMPTSVRDAK